MSYYDPVWQKSGLDLFVKFVLGMLLAIVVYIVASVVYDLSVFANTSPIDLPYIKINTGSIEDMIPKGQVS